MSKTFVRKETKVEAIKWTGLNFHEVTNFVREHELFISNPGLDPTLLCVVSSNSHCYIEIDDWIIYDNDIKTVYSCNYDAFKSLFKEPERSDV